MLLLLLDSSILFSMRDEGIYYLSLFSKRQGDRLNSLLKMVERIGNDGYMLLYICLEESCVEAKDHKNIIAELNCSGKSGSYLPN